jgi:hypothetical protein
MVVLKAKEDHNAREKSFANGSERFSVSLPGSAPGILSFNVARES